MRFPLPKDGQTGPHARNDEIAGLGHQALALLVAERGADSLTDDVLQIKAIRTCGTTAEAIRRQFRRSFYRNRNDGCRRWLL